MIEHHPACVYKHVDHPYPCRDDHGPRIINAKPTIDDLYDSLHAAIERYGAGDFDNDAAVRAINIATGDILLHTSNAEYYANRVNP